MTARPRLIALDAEDLAVISAHVQDAIVNVADVIWRQDEKRLVVAMQRCDPAIPDGASGAAPRVVSALRFDRVLACKSRDIDPGRRDTALSLSGITFHSNDPPGGSAVLMFEGGGALRLDVECLECELVNLDGDDLAQTRSDAEADLSNELRKIAHGGSSVLT